MKKRITVKDARRLKALSGTVKTPLIKPMVKTGIVELLPSFAAGKALWSVHPLLKP
jgi:hypothetical protein